MLVPLILVTILMWINPSHQQANAKEPANSKSQTSTKTVKLKSEYTYNSGEARRIEDLGIGTLDYQVTVAKVKAEQKLMSIPTRIVPPDDGIKRVEDKTIYGTDSRRHVFEIPDPAAKENASGVASISLYGERTAPARGICTAFLIAEDLAMTASHCVNNNDFRNKVLRFGDEYIGDGFLNDIEFYEIDKIEIWDRSFDLAVLKLRPNAAGPPGKKYKILELEKGEIKLNSEVYLIGHPGRDYKKFVNGCRYMVKPYVHADGKHTFGCDCTAEGGNSGSPIFNSNTHRVVGVFWGGQKDTQIISKANNLRHEYVVPMWLIAAAPKFSIGAWPPWPSVVHFAHSNAESDTPRLATAY